MLAILSFAVMALLPALTDLEATLSTAATQQQPLIVYASRTDCGYCRRLEQEVLTPLLRSQRFADQVVFAELIMDATQPIRDHQGQWRLPEEIAAEWAVTISPTILFLDADGQELIERAVGYNGNPMASFYLERAISTAIGILKAQDDNLPTQQQGPTGAQSLTALDGGRHGRIRTADLLHVKQAL